MKSFTTINGAAVALLAANIDTDVIIRVDRMTSRAPATLKKYAFEALRYDAEGKERADSPFNQPAFKDAPILLAGANFGCGSSREPAVWAIAALGIRCVVAESFGDIFFGNCFQNGILALTLEKSVIEQLAAEGADGDTGFKVDLIERAVTAPSGWHFDFDVDPQRRENLIEGLDEIDQTLKWSAEIDAWQARDRAARPWVWLPDSVQLTREVR